MKSNAIESIHPPAVILPIYSNLEITKKCILAAIPDVLTIPNACLIAINDASPDTGMQEMLEQLAAQWPNVLVVLQNEKNLGFVRTVNRGFAYFPQHDAVLLNSDAIVPQNWLSRLVDEAYSSTNIGTVTPMSNNATICSFPCFLQENLQPFGLDVDAIDTVFKHEKLPAIQAPTGVGFCMYIRRSCLNEIGYFNEKKFGKGYGEENDLCQRALKSGWLNIISPNIYVYHVGSVSFSSKKETLVRQAQHTLSKLHSNYHTDIFSFCRKNPLKLIRVTRYIQLLSIIFIPKVLHISYSLNSDVVKNINDLSTYFSEKIAHLLITPGRRKNAVVLNLRIERYADKLFFDIPSDYSSLLCLLKAIGINTVHFHHMQNLPQKVLRLPIDLGIRYFINPTVNSNTLKNSLSIKLSPEKWQEQFRLLSMAVASQGPGFTSPNNSISLKTIENMKIVSKLDEKKISSWHEKLLYILGILYTSPFMWWIRNFIPYSVRQFIKRLLRI